MVTVSVLEGGWIVFDQIRLEGADELVLEKNNEYAAKRLNISNDIIKYDLIKTEKDKLKQVEGE